MKLATRLLGRRTSVWGTPPRHPRGFHTGTAQAALCRRFTVEGAVGLISGAAGVSLVCLHHLKQGRGVEWSQSVLSAVRAEEVPACANRRLEAGSDSSCSDTTTCTIDEAKELRIIPLEELRQHRGADSCWVSYGGEVYDVTDFLYAHPGGHDPLLMAGGQAVESFWEKYHIHLNSDKALRELGGPRCPRVGRLSAEDAERALSPDDPENAGCRSAVLRAGSDAHAAFLALRRRKLRKLVLVGVQGPLWSALRLLLGFLRALRLLRQRWLDDLSRWLPVSLPGYGESRRLDPAAACGGGRGRRPRVAVVGGGIAGVGCGYALAKSGFDVVIFEARSVLGGNAQTGAFEVTDAAGKKQKLRQDLSVLYWGPEYYKNYMCLLRELHVEPHNVSLPYVVRSNDPAVTGGRDLLYTTPGTPLYEKLRALEASKMRTAGQEGSTASPSCLALEEKFAADFRRLDAMTKWVRRASTFFCLGDASTSFYKPFATGFSRLNPFNYLTFRQSTRLFGVSDAFFEAIVRPFHGIQWTTSEIDNIPGAAWGPLDDLTPITRSRKVMSWGPGTSAEVFEKATTAFPERLQVQLNTRVLEVASMVGGGEGTGGDARPHLRVRTDAGGSEGPEDMYFDRLVFACPASSAANIMARGDTAVRGGARTAAAGGGTGAGAERVRTAGWLERTLLCSVGYHDDYTHSDWRDWLEVPVHQSTNAALHWVRDEATREALLEHAAFVANNDSTPPLSGPPATAGADNSSHDDACGRAKFAPGELLPTEYTCVLGAWSPSARAAGSGGVRAPMFMTQCTCPETEARLAEAPPHEWDGATTYSAPRTHPDLSIQNLTITQMLHLIQGRRGIYYCSNFASPGNGHDLSLLSGVVVAHAIGAAYPFSGGEVGERDVAGHPVSAKAARREFELMRNFMGI